MDREGFLFERRPTQLCVVEGLAHEADRQFLSVSVELEEVRAYAGVACIGVQVHWKCVVIEEQCCTIPYSLLQVFERLACTVVPSKGYMFFVSFCFQHIAQGPLQFRHVLDMVPEVGCESQERLEFGRRSWYVGESQVPPGVSLLRTSLPLR